MRTIARVIVLLFCIFVAQPVFAALPPGFEVETIAGGLTQPTALAFTDDGRILVTEKAGAVRVIRNGALLPTPLITLTDVNAYGDRGLIGIAVDPAFATNGYLYLLYTYENTPGSNVAGPKTGRLIRVTVVGDSADISTRVVLLGTVGGTAATPSCEDYAVTADCIPSDSPSHSVGGLRFGPDGSLYATLGDGAHFDYVDPRAHRAQNLDSLAGKVLRINTDGTGRADNPFVDGSLTSNRSKVYAYGLRNAYKLNFRPTGSLYVSDVGWDSWEEVNVIVPGGNYGWPCREGNGQNGYGCDVTPRVDPVYTYPHNAAGAGAIAGGAFSTAYPGDYADSYVFGDYAQNWMKRIVVDSADQFVRVEDVMTQSDGTNGPVAVDRGPDGLLYFIAIYTGEVKRIVYSTGNRQPIAVLSAYPTNGLAPLTVSFSGTGSSDPDGHPLSYAWTFGDGGSASGESIEHTYAANGTYTAVLTVTDGQGGQSVRSVTVTVGDRAPTAHITAPQNGALYRVGDTIQLSGHGTDPEDGTITSSAQLSWDIILHHNTHTHLLETLSGPSPTFTAPDHEGATDIYTEVRLTVVDAAGLTNTRSISLYANNNPVGTGNLVRNPSLETPVPNAPQAPLDWTRGGWGVLTATYEYPAPGYDGERAGAVTISAHTSGDAKWMHAPVSVTPGTTYTFRGYYKSSAPTELLVQHGTGGGVYTYETLNWNVAPATDWTELQYTFTTPPNGQTVVMALALARVGSVHIDSFSITEGVAPPPPPPPPVDVCPLVDGVQVSGPCASDLCVAPQSWDAALQACTPPPRINLIQNPSVETPGTVTSLPQSWKNARSGTNTTVFTYPVPGYDGERAMEVRVSRYRSGEAKWYFDPVAVIPGSTYEYRHFYKASALTRVQARYTLSGGGQSVVTLGSGVPAASSWTAVTYTLTPPPGAVSVTVEHQLRRNGTLSTDHFELVSNAPPPPPPPPPPPTNLITNGSLESVTGADPTSWVRESYGTHSALFRYPVPGKSGNGFEIQLSGYVDGASYWRPQPVSMVYGRAYTLSGWYKGTTITDVIGRYALQGGGEHYFGVTKELPPVTDWTYFSATFTPPNVATTFTPLYMMTTNGTFALDELSLTITGYATSTNDLTPPTVQFTTPTSGSTVSGTVVVSASSSDNIGVTGVMFAVDGTPVTPLITAPPYTFSWNTTGFAEGPHTLKATTHDAAGNNDFVTISVIVSHTSPPPPPPTANRILNPSLEEGVPGLPTNWLQGRWGTHDAVFTYPVAGNTGARAASVSMTSYTSGDAKWYFAPVSVTAGQTYAYGHAYQSSAPTTVTAQYSRADGTTVYEDLAYLPASTAWTEFRRSLSIPTGVTSLTIFHHLSAVGSLTVDTFSLE